MTPPTRHARRAPHNRARRRTTRRLPGTRRRRCVVDHRLLLRCQRRVLRFRGCDLLEHFTQLGLQFCAHCGRLFGRGTVRADGRKIHPMYLFEVKTPQESKGAWDYYKLRATIPADQAYAPLAQSRCSLAKSN